MSKIKSKFYENQREQFLFGKTLEMLLMGVVSPSNLSNKDIEVIISDIKILGMKGFNNHSIGYILAISDSDSIQEKLLLNKTARNLIIRSDGTTLAHIIASNPASEHIINIISASSEINSIEDYYKNSVMSCLPQRINKDLNITDILRQELND